MSYDYIRKMNVVDRRISKIEFEWEIEQRPLWETLAELPPNLAVRWSDRFAAYESLSAEWALCMAYESAFRWEPPRRAQWIRALQCEFQRVLWCCRYFARVFQVLQDGYREQVFWALVDNLLSFQEVMTGGRVLPQSFRVGGVAKDMTLGDLEKTIKKCREVEERVALALGDLEEDQLLISWLSRGLMLNRDFLETKKISGPILHASGVASDFRKDKCYGPYGEIKVRCYRPEKERQGRPIDRIRAVRFQLLQSIQVVEQMARKMPEGPHCLEQEVPAELPKRGSWRAVVEAPSGALHCDLRRGSVRFRTTTTALAGDLAKLFLGLCADDFELSLASLGLDFGQGVFVEDSV